MKSNADRRTEERGRLALGEATRKERLRQRASDSGVKGDLAIIGVGALALLAMLLVFHEEGASELNIFLLIWLGILFAYRTNYLRRRLDALSQLMDDRISRTGQDNSAIEEHST